MIYRVVKFFIVRSQIYYSNKCIKRKKTQQALNFVILLIPDSPFKNTSYLI